MTQQHDGVNRKSGHPEDAPPRRAYARQSSRPPCAQGLRQHGFGFPDAGSRPPQIELREGHLEVVSARNWDTRPRTEVEFKLGDLLQSRLTARNGAAIGAGECFDFG